MFSVRLVSADSYQAQPLPQLDPAFSEFRGSEIKHVPIIRVFGSLPTGEKACLHIHGAFPYLYVPYTGEEDPASLAYRLSASLDAAINVSLGSASSSTQHVYLIQRVSGIPFYGYHKKEHQYLKIYFYNPAMIKRAADLLQNGSVLNRSLQPHEAHIPYVLQFMMDYNVYGMSMINLSGVKHRRITQSLAELGSSGHSGISENSEIDYLPSSVERQSTCELEIDAMASDILNRREIERGLDLNPGLAAIWEEERARRAQAGLQGGDSQLVNPKSPPRPPFQPTDNDLYQEQRLARRLLMISQCDESTLSTSSNRSVAYAAEVREGENLMNSSNISIPSVQRSQLVPRDDTVEDASLLDSPTIVDSPKLSADCSVLGTDDQPLVDLLVELAGGGASENSESVDTDSVLGSQVSLLPSEPRSDNEDEDIPDLNLTSLQLDSLSDSTNVRNPAEPRNLREDSSSTFHLSPFLTSREAVSGSSRSADDEETERNTKSSRTHRMPQYDGAGDVSPTLVNSSSSSDDENDSDNHKNAKEFSHLPKYNGTCEVASQSRKSESREQTTKSTCRSSNAFFPIDQWDSSACDSDRSAERPRNPYDRSLVDGAMETEASRLSTSPSSALTSDAYLGQYTAINYEPFDRLLEIGPDFVPDLEGMHSSMEIGILLSSGDSDSPESVIQESDKDTIPLDAVLNGDPCFTESAELDKSDVTELRDQYASLLGNSLLPDVHTNPHIDDDLGSVSNFSDSDYQGNEKNCCFSLNAPSPRSTAASRDSSSSSENVAPNIQEPEVRSAAKSKLSSSNVQEDCKEPRALNDNSDYNCNLVATWAELQDIRHDKHLYRLRKRKTGQWIPGVRQSRRKADRRSLPSITTQLFGRVPDSMQFQLAAENRHRSPRKVPLSNAGKSPVKRSKNAASAPPYIPAENSIARPVKKIVVEPLEEKLSTSPLPVVVRLPELEETNDESACQPLHTEASLAAFHRSIIGSDNPLAESKKSPENLYSTESFAESESLVEPALPVFEELTEDIVEIIELPDTELEIFEGTSHYSSSRSERSFWSFEHRHCTWSARQRRIIQDQVFTSDQIYVIEKRKRGKQIPPDRSVCTKSLCKLPFVPLSKVDSWTDGKILGGLESPVKTEESSSSDLPYRPSVDPAQSLEASQPKISYADLNEKIIETPNVADRLPKRKSRGRRRRAETAESSLNDTSSINSTLSSSDEEPMSFESSDWAENEGRRSVRRITSYDDARDPYNMRTTKKPPTRRKRNSRAKDFEEIRAPRACRDLPGIPGIIDYPKKRGRQRKHRNDETRVELPKPKKPLRSVLFPNWGAKREISESPNDVSKTISNGLAAENRRSSLSLDRRRGRTLKTGLSLSPLPKRNHARLEDASKPSDRKIYAATNVKQMPENEALNSMIREVKCPSTRAKLKMLIKSRRGSKFNSFISERKLSATGEERASEPKIATAIIPTSCLVQSAIPRIRVAAASTHDEEVGAAGEDDRISLDEIVADPDVEKKRLSANAPEEPKIQTASRNCVDKNSEAPTDDFVDEAARAGNGDIVNPVEVLDFETPALSVVFDASGDILGETEFIQDSVSTKIRNEESPNDPKQLSFRSDKYAMSVTNFFTASNYTIDAVSLEIPTCLFEEDSNSVEQRLPRRVVQDASRSEDRRAAVDDTASSLDPRDLDVYDAESLTPSSSFSQLAEATESSLDSSELSLSSVLDDSTKSELSTMESRYSGKTREGQGSSVGAACKESDEDLSEEESPEFEALSPSPKICEILGNSLEEQFDTDRSSRVGNFEGSIESAEFAREESRSEGSDGEENEARLDEEMEGLVSNIVVRLGDEPELASGETEVRLRKGENGSNILPGTKSGAECKDVFEEREIALSRKGEEEVKRNGKDWEDSASTENEAIMEKDFLKEKEIWSDERESEESITMDNDREALAESRMEKETPSMDISTEKVISRHEKEIKDSMTTENDEKMFPRSVNEIVSSSAEAKEAGTVDREEKQQIERLIVSESEAEVPLNHEKDKAIDSEKKLPIDSRLITSRNIVESIIAWKAGVLDKEQRNVDQEEEQPIAAEKNLEALPIALSEPELRFIHEKVEPIEAAIESEKKLPIDSEADFPRQLITSRKIVQSIVAGKEELLSAITESETKSLIDSEDDSQQPLSAIVETSEPFTSEDDANSPSMTIANDEEIFARTVNETELANIREEKEPIAAKKNPELLITESETKLPLINEKNKTVDAAIEVENKLSIDSEDNARESSIAKAQPVTSEDDAKSPSAIREAVEPTIISNDEEFLAGVSSEEESSAAEAEEISGSNWLECELAKVSQVDGNMNDAETEQRESRLSSMSGVETRKEPFKCRPVTIKLVSLDLSRISGFGLKSRSKSPPAVEPSNEHATLAKSRKLSDDFEEITEEAGRKIGGSATARKRHGRSQPTRNCAGETKLESKFSEEKIQPESENFREKRILETGEKISRLIAASRPDSEEENTFEALELSSREVEEKDRKNTCKVQSKSSSVSRAEKKIEEYFTLNGEENGGVEKAEEKFRGIETSSTTTENGASSVEDDRTSIEDELSEKNCEINFEKSSSESNSLREDFGREITDESSEELFPRKTVDEDALFHARRVKAKGKMNGRFACRKLRGRGRRVIKSPAKKIAREISEASREFVPMNQENSSQTDRDEHVNAETMTRSPENELKSANAPSPKCDSSPQKSEEKNSTPINLKSMELELFGKRSEEHVGMLDAEKLRVNYAINGRFGSKKLRGRTRRVVKSRTKKIAREISETFRKFVPVNLDNSVELSCDEDGFVDKAPSLECDSSRRKTEQENMALIVSKPKEMERFGKRSGEHVEILDSEGKKSREKCSEEIDEKIFREKCSEEIEDKISGEKCAKEIDEKMSGKKYTEEIDEKPSRKKCAEEIEKKMSQELNSPSQENFEKIEPKSTRSHGNKISESVEDITTNASRSAKSSRRFAEESIERNTALKVRFSKKSTEENVELIAESTSQDRKKILKENIESKTARGVRSGKNPPEEINITTEEIDLRESDLSSLQSENDIEPIAAKPRRRGRPRKSSKANLQEPKKESPSPIEEISGAEKTARNLSSQTLLDEPIGQNVPIKREKKVRVRKTALTNAGLRCAENPSSQEETSKTIAEETFQSEPSSQQSLVESCVEIFEKKIPIKPEKKARIRKTQLTSADHRCLENSSLQDVISKRIVEETSESEQSSQPSLVESDERTSSKPRKRGRARRSAVKKARNLSPECPSSQEEDAPIEPMSPAKHKKMARLRKKLMEEVDDPAPKCSSLQEEDIRDSLGAKIVAKFRGRGRGRGRSTVNVRKRSLGTSSSRTERFPDVEENAPEKSELSTRENVLAELETNTSEKPRGRGRKNALSSLEAPSSREEINWNNVESISRESEESSRRSIDELKSSAKLKRKGRVCKSSVDITREKTRAQEAPSSQDESDRERTDNTCREPEVPSKKITDDDIEPKSPVELKKKCRSRKSSAVGAKTPLPETPSTQEQSDRETTENSSQEPEVPRKISEEANEPKSYVEPKKKGRGRKSSAEAAPLLEKSDRDRTENSSQEPEVPRKITDEERKSEPKNPVKLKRKGRGRKNSAANKTPSLHVASLQESHRDGTVNASLEQDFSSPASSLSIITMDEKMETKTSLKVEKKNRARKSQETISRESSSNHRQSLEKNGQESTATKSPETLASPPKLAKDKIPTKTSITSKKIAHVSCGLEIDDAECFLSESVTEDTLPEVVNPPLKSSSFPGFEELSLKNTKLIVDRNPLLKPKKRVRFDEASIRSTSNLTSTDLPPEETAIEEPSSRKHQRFSSNTKLTEANNFAGKDDKRSNSVSNTDLNCSEAVVEFRSCTLIKDQAGNTSNPSERRLVEGANGLRESKKLKFNFSDNLSLDSSSLQKASGKLSESCQIPTTSENPKDIETRRSPKRSRECVQPRKPIVVLKRLSRDSLRSHGYAFRSKSKKFVKNLKKSGIDDFLLPAYDGAADLTSSDSEDEADLTIASDEKRVCIYQSGKKPAASRRDSVVTPKKRKLDEADDDAAGPSSKRRARPTSADTPKKSSHRSPSRTSMLKSPGRLSGYYSPLKIIVTSPKVRRETSQSRETIRPENRDANVSSSGSVTPGRKRERLHESMMRGRISATKSSMRELGGRHEYAATMGSERSGELDGIASVGHEEGGSVNIAARTISNEPAEATSIRDSTAIPRDSRDVRKRLVFFSTGDKSGVGKSSEPADEPKRESKEFNVSSERSRDFGTIKEAEEPIELDNLADRRSTISVAERGPSRSGCAPKSDDRDPYDVTTDEESANEDEALDFTLSQYVDSRTKENRDLLDRSEVVAETMETRCTPKHRNKEPIELSDNLADPKSTIHVAEPGPSHSAPKLDDRDSCDVANDEEIASDDETFDVTFSQYIDSRLSENRALLDRSEVDAASNDERVILRPKFDPPSRRSVLETMESYGIPRHRNQEPFFSVDADVPRQKELAHRMLKVPGKSLKDVPAFVSSVDGVTGIARWRKMKIAEFVPSLTRSNDVEVKIALCSNDKVVLTPLARPPTRKEAKDWLRAREYLKKKKDDDESRRKKLEEKEKIDTRAAETEDECSSNASDLSAAEPSPENAGGKSEQERALNRGLKMRLAKRGLLKKMEEATGRKTRHGSEEEIEVDSQRAGSRKGSADSNSTELDPSLLSVLGKSRLFREQEASRHLGVSCGQIEFLSDSTRSNVANENLQNAKALTRYQYLTIMCLEVHVTTRGDLLPDAQCDSIAAIFYSVQSDVPPTSTIKPLEHGVIVVAETDKAKNKMHYSYASKFPWSISFAHNEEALLNSLVTLITRVDPEILIGWELETLSWGYVFQRASILGMNLYKRISRIPATQGKWEAQPRDIETLAEVKLPGRIVLDIWRIMRHEAALLSYTFESMMHHVLNERIPCPSFKTLTDWWNLERPRPSRWRVIEHYSIRILGVFRILDQLDIIGRTSELARLFGIQFFEVFSRGSQYRVESVMLRLAKPLNYIAVSPSAQQRASMRAMEALPLIMEPESMFYSDPLIVLDFQSLYPSIIIAHNYCFSTCLGRIEHIGQPEPFEFGAYTLRVPKSTSLKLQGKVNFAPCGVAFVKPEVCLGVLPRMLTEILETRFMVKKAMKDHKRDDKTLQRALHSRQMGLKFLANVTYGYTAANFSGRMPCIEVGDSVVSKSKETLERAIKLVETTPKWGARVVYGDTDSLFILVPGKSKADAFVIGNEIADAVTAANPPPIKLKFEKVVYPGILQTKKRYCGYMYETPEQENPTYLAKGIETVRRDGCPAVSKILEKTLKILFETKDVSLVKKYVTRQLDKVLRGKVSIQDLTFAKEFRGLKGYKAKACVPALELTKRLMKKDPRAVPRNSERVRYVIVAGAPNQALIHCVRTPWELINDPGLRPNGIYYVTRVIIPPLNRCLNLMGVDVNAWYREMPHRHILDNPVGQPGDRQKLTIFQYFGTIVCAVCGQSSNKGICTECVANPPDALVVLHDKLRRLDRTDSHVTAICQSCVGQADVADCASLDCPVLYRRAQAQRELTQAAHLRTIIECGNKLEL